MQGNLYTGGIVCAVLAVLFLVATIVLFFVFRIPALWKDVSGSLEREQIADIRAKNTNASRQKGKVNVFEDLEKKAKVRKGNTQSLNISSTSEIFAASRPQPAETGGTTVLSNSGAIINPDFKIEKNIMYVSTSEVI